MTAAPFPATAISSQAWSGVPASGPFSPSSAAFTANCPGCIPYRLEDASDIRRIQELLCCKDVSTTTMLCTQALNRGPTAVQSPSDRLLATNLFLKEIHCKIPQPTSAGYHAPDGRQIECPRPLPGRSETPCQENGLRPLQRLRYSTELSTCSGWRDDFESTGT